MNFKNDSLKAVFPERKHFETETHLLPGPLLNYRNVKDEREVSLVLVEQGKVHLNSRISEEDSFRPGLKMVDYLLHSADIVQRGIRHSPLEPVNPVLDPKSRVHKNHLKMVPDISMKTTESSEMPCGWNKKHIVSDSDGNQKSLFRSSEYNLDGVMTRKKRIDTVEERRNFIPVRRLGDKPYAIPDHSSKYCYEEGLIPGTTIAQRHSLSSSSNMNVKSLYYNDSGPKLGGLEKQKAKKRNQELENELHEVQSLTHAGSVLGQKIMSWEERTGLWLVKPEDDDDDQDD